MHYLIALLLLCESLAFSAAGGISLGRSSYLKKQPLPTEQLRDLWFADPHRDDSCQIEMTKGQRLSITAFSDAESEDHVFVELLQSQESIEFPGCSLREGYILREDLAMETLEEPSPNIPSPDEERPSPPPTPPHDTLVSRALVRIPLVLMYHDVVADEASLTTPSDVTVQALEEHLLILRELGYQFLDLEDYLLIVERGQPIPRRSVILTFDDGYIGNFRHARPILRTYRAPATFFVHTNFIGVTQGAKPKMSWDQLVQLERDPLFRVESHTLSHPKLAELPEKTVERELVLSKQTLENRLEKNVLFLAYPYGSFNATVKDVARRHYRLSFAVENSPSSVDRETIPRLSMGRAQMSREQFKRLIETWTRRFSIGQ
jgi:peptidoglycan/xylan/chitin deacetylase (PgdA/CDA1 family)